MRYPVIPAGVVQKIRSQSDRLSGLYKLRTFVLYWSSTDSSVLSRRCGPMTIPRPSPYLYATWIPRYLVGDKSCLWACWFKANFRDYAKMPSDFDSARWNMEHTDLMNKLIADLEEQGCQVYIESQNSFRVESSRSGAVISGKPDLIAVFPDGRTVVFDAKTGLESAAHTVQVQLYMYLLPRSELVRWKGRNFEGAVTYANDHQIDVPATSVDSAFVSRLSEFMQKMTSHMPPRRVPSKSECGFCELTRDDCPARFSPDSDTA